MSSLPNQNLEGVHIALFTPLCDDDPKLIRNSIDYKKAAQMMDDLMDAGIQGLVPVGTTGQSATLSHQQHLDFIKFVIEYVGSKINVIAGAGSNCTRESIDMIQNIQKIADVPVLCVTGYYNNPTKEGIYRHFNSLSVETGAKIVIYNVPGRTSSYVSPDTIIALAEDSNIIGLKQAVNFKIGGKFREDTKRIIKETQGKNFSILTGEDDSLSDVLELGGQGIISATANIPEAAKIYLQIFQAFKDGERARGVELQKTLRDYVDLCFIRKNPIPLGTFFNSPLYLPLIPVLETEDGQEAHREIIEMINTSALSLKKYH